MAPLPKRVQLLELIISNQDTFRDDGGIPLPWLYKVARVERIFAKQRYMAGALKDLAYEGSIKVMDGRVVVEVKK